MLFAYLTLTTALIISITAAVYSILGLTAIFAAAFWPIVIMGGSLEVGKIVATLWLHKYWKQAEIQYKMYLCFAVAILMMLTSMGVFGFLSKAHGDQSLVSGDSSAKVAIYDEKIKISRENIDANRKALKQMDEAVDQVMGRSTDEKGADKAVAIRRGQSTERNRLLKEIEAEQKKITALNEERAPLAAENRKIEAEVGPVKYIAALIYGDNPEANVLEKAVRWVIILIVIVFDPLALTLLLAATKSIEWERGINIFNPNKKREEEEEKEEEVTDKFEDKHDGDEPVIEPTPVPVPVDVTMKKTAGQDVFAPKIENGIPVDIYNDDHIAMIRRIKPDWTPPVETPKYEPDDGPLTTEQVEQIQELANQELPQGEIISREDLFEPLPETTKPVEEVDPIVDLSKAIYAAEHPDEDLDSHHQAHASGEITTLPWHSDDHVNSLPISDGERKKLKEMMKLQPDNVPAPAGNVTGFGINFPTTPIRGDLFLRVDQLPTQLYKFNGAQWIMVDKNITDTYVYDEAYIDHLIEKIGTGEYDLDLLSDAEREQIESRLKQTGN